MGYRSTTSNFFYFLLFFLFEQQHRYASPATAMKRNENESTKKRYLNGSLPRITITMTINSFQKKKKKKIEENARFPRDRRPACQHRKEVAQTCDRLPTLTPPPLPIGIHSLEVMQSVTTASIVNHGTAISVAISNSFQL